MCGIVGRVSRAIPGVPAGSLAAALQAMHHRGPDASAEETLRVGDWNVGLGHARLSILDLSTEANQPLASGSGEQLIVFNGEIYNHAALREELRAQGLALRTRSDTEVLLAGISHRGTDWLPRLNGMFAFALLDKARQQLLLARDPFGIKPLYFCRSADGGLAFASEIRALGLAAGRKPEADPGCLAEFLLNGFLYEPASGFRDIHKLMPGEAMSLDLRSMQLQTWRFHDPLTQAATAGGFEDLLQAQMRLEVQADVPVGVFFSGGMDSSVLAAAAPPGAHGLFVHYGETASDDSVHAPAIARELGLALQTAVQDEAELSPAAIIDEFRAVARGTEEPISDFTYSATQLLSRFARQAGFKVMLSGMGGDELFAGYPRQWAARRWEALHRLQTPIQWSVHLLRRSPSWAKRADRLAAFAAAARFSEAYCGLVGYFSAGEVTRLLGSRAGADACFDRLDTLLQPVRHHSLLRQALVLDRHGYLAHNLTVTDRASMAESIEVRVPLLNTALEAHARELPDQALVQGNRGKLPLRQYLHGKLPRQLVDRRKVGFNPPLDGRIRRLGRERCADLIGGSALAWALDTRPALGWVEEHFRGERNHTYRIWQLIYLGMWLDEHRA